MSKELDEILEQLPKLAIDVLYGNVKLKTNKPLDTGARIKIKKKDNKKSMLDHLKDHPLNK